MKRDEVAKRRASLGYLDIGAVCPYCNSTRIRTKETRPYRRTKRRRKVCLDCSNAYSTLEVPEWCVNQDDVWLFMKGEWR